MTARRTADPTPDSTPDLAPLRWWDLAEVADLEQQVFAHDPWSPAQFWAELARVPETRWYVVARRDGVLLGYAGLFVVGPEADVQTVAVAPAAQGHGVGRALLGALLDRAGELGAGTVHLEVRADNEAALGLYRAFGFEVDGRRRDYYGRGHDALLMTRRAHAPQEAGRG